MKTSKYFLIFLVFLFLTLSSCQVPTEDPLPATSTPIPDTLTATITSTSVKLVGSYITPQGSITSIPKTTISATITPTPQMSVVGSPQSIALTDVPTEDFGYHSSATQDILQTQSSPSNSETSQSGITTPVSTSTSSQATSVSGVSPSPTVFYTNTPAPPACQYDTNSAFETTLLSLINDLRSSMGLAELVVQGQLTAAAHYHSEDMACFDFYDHIGSNDSNLLQRVELQGYEPSKIGENLYVGNGTNNNPQKVFDAWIIGPFSYSQMTDSGYSEIGIGYVYKANSSYGGYFTVVFGAPAAAGGE